MEVRPQAWHQEPVEVSECWRGPPTIGKMDRFNTTKLGAGTIKSSQKSQSKLRLQIPVNKHMDCNMKWCTLMQSCTNQSSGGHVVNYPIKTKSLLLTSSAFGEAFWDCFGEALASIGWGGVAGEAGSALSDFSAPSCQEIASHGLFLLWHWHIQFILIKPI